jgi:predicted transcriptional regulator
MVRPRYLFLPIHSELAIAILQGRKKWELRTRRPAIDSGDVVVLYATALLKAVVGSFIAGEIISGAPGAVWAIVREEVATTRGRYFERFGGAQEVHAIQVRAPRRIDPYTPRFRIGQGWRYLDGRGNSKHRSVIERINGSR